MFHINNTGQEGACLRTRTIFNSSNLLLNRLILWQATLKPLLTCGKILKRV